MSELRVKRNSAVSAQIKPVVSIVRSWFLDTGLKYLQQNNLTDAKEAALEAFTDYYLDSLDKIERS